MYEVPVTKVARIKHLVDLCDRVTSAYRTSGFIGVDGDDRIHVTPPEFYRLFGSQNYEYKVRDSRPIADMPLEVVMRLGSKEFFCLVSNLTKCSEIEEEVNG